MRARFYNPVIGRFTQEDVYRGDGLNLYAYCGNNPVGYWDPSGYLCSTKINQYNKEVREFKGNRGEYLRNKYKEKIKPKTNLFNKSGKRIVSKEDTKSIIKSIRRHLEKGYTKTRPHARAALDNGNYGLYGTYFHNSVFKRVKMLNIDGLDIDKVIIKPGGNIGVKGEMRRPDFQWKLGTEEYDIWDLKPQGYDWTNEAQYRDIIRWTGIEPTQLNYHRYR